MYDDSKTSEAILTLVNDANKEFAAAVAASKGKQRVARSVTSRMLEADLEFLEASEDDVILGFFCEYHKSLQAGCSIFLTGEIPSLGSWDVNKAVPINEHGNLFIVLHRDQLPFEFKFIIRKHGKILWQRGGNRRVGKIPERETMTVTFSQAEVTDADKNSLNHGNYDWSVYSWALTRPDDVAVIVETDRVYVDKGSRYGRKVSELQQVAGDLTDERDQLSHAVDGLRADQAVALGRVRDLEHDIRALQDLKARLETSVTEAEASNRILEHKLETAEATVATVQAERDATDAAIARRLEESDAKVRILEATLAKRNSAEAAETAANHSELDRSRARWANEEAALSAKVTELQGSLTAATAQAASDASAAASKIAALETAVQTAAADQARAAQVLATAVENTVQLEATVGVVRADKAALQMAATEAATEEKRLQSELAALEEAEARHQRRIAELEHDVTRLQTDHDALERTLAATTKQLGAAEARAVDLDQANAVLRAEVADQRQRWVAVLFKEQGQHGRLARQLDALTTSLTDTSVARARMEADLEVARHSEDARQAETKVRDAAVERRIAAMVAQTAALESALADAVETRSSVEEELLAYKASAAALSCHLAAMDELAMSLAENEASLPPDFRLDSVSSDMTDE